MALTEVEKVKFCLGGGPSYDKGLVPFTDDTQINEVLAEQPIPALAAAIIVEGIMARVSIEVDFTSGATAYKASQKLAALEKLLKRLRDNPGDFPGGDDGSGVANTEVWAGGQSISEMQGYERDTDLVQPNFSIGQFDDDRGDGYSEDDT